MEKEGENLMKFIASFLLGAAIGAIAALLLAPSSGEELRSNLKTQTDVQAARAREEWHKGVQGLQERVNKMHREQKQPAALPVEAEPAA
jgi:gas vesicle protein